MKEAVLRFCNEVRADYGLPPVDKLRPGGRSKPSSCPISKTIKYDSELRVISWPGQIIVTNNGGFIYMKPPSEIDKFINDFDYGQYPELELS